MFQGCSELEQMPKISTTRGERCLKIRHRFGVFLLKSFHFRLFVSGSGIARPAWCLRFWRLDSIREWAMKFKRAMFTAVVLVSLTPACVSSRQAEESEVNSYPISNQTYGILDREDEVYPWLSPKYDKGIYSSSAQTAPFRDNSLTTENLRKRIQKTSKKSK